MVRSKHVATIVSNGVINCPCLPRAKEISRMLSKPEQSDHHTSKLTTKQAILGITKKTGRDHIEMPESQSLLNKFKTHSKKQGKEMK